MARVASKVAKRYHRRLGWRGLGTEREELEQVAWAALLHAHRGGSYDPLVGEFGAWCWRIAEAAVSREVLVTGSPVTSSQNGTRERAERACNHTRVDVEVIHWVAEHRTPEHRLKLEQWKARVRERVSDLVGDSGAAFIIAVVSREWTPEEIAEHHDQPVQNVYAARAKAARRLRDDPVLLRLWREMEH